MAGPFVGGGRRQSRPWHVQLVPLPPTQSCQLAQPALSLHTALGHARSCIQQGRAGVARHGFAATTAIQEQVCALPPDLSPTAKSLWAHSSHTHYQVDTVSTKTSPRPAAAERAWPGRWDAVVSGQGWDCRATTVWGQGPGQNHDPVTACPCDKCQFHKLRCAEIVPGSTLSLLCDPKTPCPPMASSHLPGQACPALEGPRSVSMETTPTPSGMPGGGCGIDRWTQGQITT